MTNIKARKEKQIVIPSSPLLEKNFLVDSHCHLNFPEFSTDLPDVLTRAHSQGVGLFLTINTRLDQTLDLQAIADRYPEVFYTVGVHPNEAERDLLPSLPSSLTLLSQHPKAVGIGETGLDFFYDRSCRRTQIDSFEHHLQVAQESHLPVIVHTRSADEETLACLRRFPHVKGVLHCFSGTLELAKAAIDLGFFLSFSGILTFKKADDLRKIARQMPLDRLLIETDSPFLAPIPHRGQRNEPAFVEEVARTLAEIKSLPLETIAQETTRNFLHLFDKVPKYNGFHSLGKSLRESLSSS